MATKIEWTSLDVAKPKKPELNKNVLCRIRNGVLSDYAVCHLIEYNETRSRGTLSGYTGKFAWLQVIAPGNAVMDLPYEAVDAWTEI